MDWKLLALSFVTVFISELGDKSQIAAVALGGTSRFPVSVFLGTSAALILTSFLGVILGQGTAELLPSSWIKLAAALGFTILGVRLLLDSNPAEAEVEPEE
ncbi:MAG: TMEM165/GDT1 family protein [Prochlorotrichaceae cyanobacterium]|jgi:putative Ca2+/H+ antiporter (TMEM165/GDT1 family)